MKRDDAKQLSPSPYDIKRRRWFEVFGGVTVANWRLFLIAVALSVVALAEAVALSMMAPLKTAVPYVVKVEKEGRVTVEPALTQKYVPGQSEIDYALSKWVKNLLTIDFYLTSNPKRNNILEAYAMTRGKASEEFVQWFKENKPVEAVSKDPSLTRVAHVGNFMRVQEGAVIIRVTTETRSAKQNPETENKMVTIHYSIVPPKPEKEILENPLGLVITHFAISKDLT